MLPNGTVPPLAATYWLSSVIMPAKTGADAEVPPTIELFWTAFAMPLAQLPPEQKMYPSWFADAEIEISGTSRTPSAGTPVPTCHDGFGNPPVQEPADSTPQLLFPPPVAAR